MLDSSRLGVFIAASLVLLVTPGPAVVYIVTRSIDQGWIAGVVSSLGMAVGSLVHVTVAWLGMSAILFSSDNAFVALKYAGAAYLMYLGVQTLQAGNQVQASDRLEQQGLQRVFSQAIVVNLLNPKSALFFIAFMPQFVDRSRGTVAGQLLFLSGVFFALAIITDTTYALLAGKLGDLLRSSPTFRRRQRYVTAAMYIGLGLAAAFSGVV